MAGAPEPYESPTGVYKYRISTRFDDALELAMQSLMPNIRNFGFESEADLIRTAVYEFCKNHSNINNRLLDAAARQARSQSMINNIGNSYVQRSIATIQQLIGLGLNREALEEKKLTLSYLATLEPRVSKILTAQFSQNPIVGGLVDPGASTTS